MDIGAWEAQSRIHHMNTKKLPKKKNYKPQDSKRTDNVSFFKTYPASSYYQHAILQKLLFHHIDLYSTQNIWPHRFAAA